MSADVLTVIALMCQIYAGTGNATTYGIELIDKTQRDCQSYYAKCILNNKTDDSDYLSILKCMKDKK